MSNVDLRQEIKLSGIRFWQVAEELGLNDGNFSRKLRKELSGEEKECISVVVERLKVQQLQEAGA